MQPNGHTIQQEMTNKISLLLGEPLQLVGQGRTDTGVHALLSYAHFDYDKPIFDGFVHKLNRFLPHDIAVIDLLPVVNHAHARFSAIARTYQYRIHQKKDPFLQANSCYFHPSLDFDSMNLAANVLLEYQDFSCFSKSNTQVFTNICKVTAAKWQKDQAHSAVFTITANRFLRNMVRAIVGTLLQIGIGKLKVDAIHQIIQQKERSGAGESVPAHALYLTDVEYPPDIWLQS